MMDTHIQDRPKQQTMHSYRVLFWRMKVLLCHLHVGFSQWNSLCTQCMKTQYNHVLSAHSYSIKVNSVLRCALHWNVKMHSKCVKHHAACASDGTLAWLELTFHNNLAVCISRLHTNTHQRAQKPYPTINTIIQTKITAIPTTAQTEACQPGGDKRHQQNAPVCASFNGGSSNVTAIFFQSFYFLAFWVNRTRSVDRF